MRRLAISLLVIAPVVSVAAFLAFLFSSSTANAGNIFRSTSTGAHADFSSFDPDGTQSTSLPTTASSRARRGPALPSPASL